MVSRCKFCERHRTRNINDPLMHHKIINLFYEKIGMDICEHKGLQLSHYGLLLSNWLDIIKLSNKTSDEMIPKLKAIFSSHGVSKVIVWQY